MALRFASDLVASTRSAKVGDIVSFSAKVENSGGAEASVLLAVEDLKEGSMSFEPTLATIAPKARGRVEFRWTAALPEGKPAHTWRGRLVVRTPEGKLVGSAALDLYVSA